MKKSLFVLLATGVLVVSCNVGPFTSGPDQQTVVNSTESVTPTDICAHELQTLRHDGGAEIVDPEEGTFYECPVDEIHESFGGEMVYEGHFAENTSGLSFSLHLSRGYEIEIGGDGFVEISDEHNLQMVLIDGDDDEDDDHGDNDDEDWVDVPEPGTYHVLKLRKVGHDHGRSSGVGIITTPNVVIVDKSGTDQGT
ncbi:MAG: hypothetical protein HQ509_03730 [Candidatus Marinimicrobia bacterium]|nr:hypothetical protein [Candidatus Neomarinimicrobiota bacterium]